MPLRFYRWPNQVHQPTERLLSYRAHVFRYNSTIIIQSNRP
ncbi:hypothetical protein [Candidatus Avelusimicrobium fimicolum]